MKAVLVTSLVILLFVFMEHTTAQRHICPPWFELDPRSNTGCSCTNADEAIVCGSDFPLLHLGFCMTYNSSSGTTTVSNNCALLSGGDFPHKSLFLSTECPCVHESDCSVNVEDHYQKGSDLLHQSNFFPTECPCVHESNCSVHNTTKCTP